nr:EAL domain-containing protein [Dechloromonas sp.]
MTTISAELPGRIDLAAFGLQPEDLASLQALSGEWSAAVAEAFSTSGADAHALAFADLTAGLAMQLGALRWQDEWLRAWARLHTQGIPTSTLVATLNAALDLCAAALFGAGRVPHVHLDLFTLLRRAVLALLACAVDLGEEARAETSGMLDERAALARIRGLLAEGRRLALLALSANNRDALVHLSASDLQSVPGLVAGRIEKLLRDSDDLFAGRDGEWLLVLPDIHSMAQPALAGSQILHEFSQPLRLPSGKPLAFDVRIGAAMAPEHAGEAEGLLAASRLGRWGAQLGREGFGWFHTEIEAAWKKRFHLAAEFKQALDNERLQFFLQPQVDAATGRCFGAELLLRWQCASGEWISPQRLMEVVDENGWRRQYTDWMLRHAMRIAAEIEGVETGFRLSLNLTSDDLNDEDCVDMIRQRLDTWQMSGERFTLELTESAMMANRERALDTLTRLRDLGFRLAIDDFGTGYSSLSYLVGLPVKEIKIDRSFIVAMGRSDEYRRVVRSIIDLAHDLDMMPLAEGVEEKAQVEQLLSLGCSRIQGYFYARPMPPEAFAGWLAARQA